MQQQQQQQQQQPVSASSSRPNDTAATTFEYSWPEDSRGSGANVMSGLSGLYAMILVIVYVAFSFTELVTFPENQKILEKNGFFLFLYLGADVFLVYIFWFTLAGHRIKGGQGGNNEEFRIVENHRVNEP